MITNYKIENNETLILYMNYDYEFANIENINKRLNLIKSIKEYINKMKIKFNGKYIVLVIAGISSITLVCNSSILNSDKLEFIPNKDIIEILKTDPYPYSFKDVIKKEINTEVKQDEIVINTSKKENNKTKKETTTQDKVEVSKNNSKNTNKDANKNNETKENINNSIMVTIYRSNGTVETKELETYLIGVVAAEMPASFNIEALKAQAIISRTYALKKIESGQILTDTVSTQSYKDDNQLKKMWGNDFNTYYSKIKKAVSETNGLVIKYNNKLIDAVFHSTSNGYTVDAKDVWGNDIPYLKSVSSNYDLNASSYLRETMKEIEEITNKLEISINENSEIIISKDKNGRVIEISIDDNIFNGIKFRNLLGLRSTDFDIVLENNQIKFITRGYGHGVGMSQYGANGMANAGYDYKQIINHYYTNVTIIKT